MLASMRRLRIRRHSDLARYWWERSGSRTLPVRSAFRPSPGSLARIGTLSAPPADPTLTVCVPTTNRLDLLVPCLESLALTCAAQPVEVIIGDTGSTEQTLELYSRLGLRTASISPPFNFSRACNAMARLANGDGLLFLNSDTRAVTPDWVQRLRSSSDNEIVGAALVYPGTRRLQHAGIEVAPARGFLHPNAYRPHRRHRTRVSFALQNIGTGARLETIGSRPANVVAVTGAFLHTSRTRFDSLGGFDEAYRSDLQDVDYCLRARAHGMQVICRRDIVFSHKHAASRGRYRFPLDDWRLFIERWEPELERWANAQRGDRLDPADGGPNTTAAQTADASSSPRRLGR
jgi:GT2 family glycosyltransferase